MDEEGWDIRETFAFFGRAFYMASVVEVGLAHALMFTEFMMQERNQFLAKGAAEFDRKTYEARFDAYMDAQFAQTMGNLIKRLDGFSGLETRLVERIKAAKL